MPGIGAYCNHSRPHIDHAQPALDRIRQDQQGLLAFRLILLNQHGDASRI